MTVRHGVMALVLVSAWAQGDAVPAAARLADKGHVEEARKLLMEALRKNPKDEDANALLGKIAFDRKEYAEAAARFRKAPAVLKKNPLLLVNHAEALLETGSADEARRALDRVPERDAAAQFESGLVLARRSDFEAAAKHFRLAQAGYSDAQVAGYNLALAQSMAGKFRDSAETLEQMRRRGLESGDVLNLLGLDYIELGEAARALEVLRLAIRQNPRDERNYVAVGKLAVEQDMMQAGLELLEQGLKNLPDSYGLLMQRAYLRLSRGEHSAAEADYRRSIQLQPRSEGARTGLAFVFMQDGRNAEAETLLRDLIRLRPSNAFVLYLLADLLARQDQEDQALALLERAAASDPGFAAARANLGKLYLKRNNLQAAVRELEEAARLDPEDSTASYQLAQAYRKSGEPEKADRALADVRRLNEEQRRLGATLFMTRRFRKAGREALAPQ